MITIFNGRRRTSTETEQVIYAQFDVELRQYMRLFIQNKDLNAWGIFTVIALHADENGWSYPSSETLRNETGIKTNAAISRSVSHLRSINISEHPIIHHYRQRLSDGRWGRSYYHMFPDAGGADKPPVKGLELWIGLPEKKDDSDDPLVDQPLVADRGVSKDNQESSRQESANSNELAVTPPENSQPDNPPAIDHPSLLQQFPTVILPPSESSGDSPPKVPLKGSPPLPEPSGYITVRDLFKRWPDDGYVYRHAKTGREVTGIKDKGNDLFEIKLNGASFGELTSPEKGDVSIAYISRALEEQRQQALKELPPRNLPATGVKTQGDVSTPPPAPSGALQAAKPTVKVANGLASTPPALPHVPPRTVVAVAEPPAVPKPLSPQQLLYNAVAVNFFDVEDYRHIPPELTPLIGKVRKALLKFFPDIDAAQVNSFGTWWHTTYPGIDLRSDVKLPARFGEWKTQQAQVDVKRKKNQPHPITCKCKGEGILPTTDEFGYYAVYRCPGEGEWAEKPEPPPKPVLKPGQHPETCQCKGKGVTFVTDHEGRWAVPCPGPTPK